MASDDMDHMNHLETVALSDCAVLQNKEATYQGSWKRAGGRSAWFMARRNLDRLITMMAHVPLMIEQELIDTTTGNVTVSLQKLQRTLRSEDIFSMIAANPGGEDGTVLAIIRDARRYFMLVEAEMIAEGVVQPEAQTYEQESMYIAPETDVYQLIADEKGMSREDVKDAIYRFFYNSDGIMCQRAKASVRIEFNGETGNSYTFNDARNIRISSIGDTLTIEMSRAGSPPPIPVPDTPSCGDGSFDARVRTAGNGGYAMEQAARHRDAIADGGSQHAGTFPWEVGKVFHAQLKERIGDEIDQWWRQMTPTMWRLYPVVTSMGIPRELQRIYDLSNENARVWVMRLDILPSELRDEYPRLQREMNAKEFEGVGEFNFMYNLVGEKYMLRNHYSAWGAEA